ncbi:5' nucleotidase, NT5C type [Bacteroides reticulotermitis]|nr:5'-nucleotidase [Bacteroides reticulotermitis]MBB4044958.1 5'(3')-deoxyribonucleotidase [Bacteroides reticulotermitis]
MKRILVDMDGVLADVYSQFLKLEAQETGILRTKEETNGFIESEAFPFYEKHVHSSVFFRTAPLMDRSVEGLDYLNRKYEVIILSSATEFPQSLMEKELWLNEHYSFISWEQMIFCGRKDVVQGDIMIDDHPKNLNLFSGERIIFTQPHNINVEVPESKRVFNWDNIMDIL